MGMQPFTFVAPGVMSPVPRLGGDGGTAAGGGALTLATGSHSNVKFRLDGGPQSSSVTVPADGQAHTVTIDVYYK